MESDHPDLARLRRRLEEEDAAYASVLAAIDRLAAFALPAEGFPELPALRERINTLWHGEPPATGSGLRGRFRRAARAAVAPALARQEEFNAALVRLLNGYLDESARVAAHLRELVDAIVRYLQRVLPVIDARDRMATALATARSELILEAFDRKLESLGRRIEGLGALRDRLETVSEQTRAIRAALEPAPPVPQVGASAARAAADAVYTAFENRFRGSREEVRQRLAGYVELFRGQSPVADLGCGRGEFLSLLAEDGIAARGVEASAAAVHACRAMGLDVALGDAVDFLAGEKEGALGGVFAAQVAEHLPPRVLQRLLAEAHRALRPGGILVLETINPRSLVAFLEIYNRDLTHERPLHPDTLAFLAAAQGFADVRVELRSPVDPAAKLQAVTAGDLPDRATRVLNENVGRLNALLYAPQEYALVARR